MNNPTIETKTKKELVNEYIGKQANLYFRTYKAVKAESELENIELSTEDLRTISTTIFIATQRKFNLCEPDRLSKPYN
jgi:hypothetical protein